MGMDRRTTDALAKFCIEQHGCFSPHDWLFLDDIDEKAVALAAKYLSMTSWYGREDALEEIAERIHAFEGNSTGLYRESRLLDFDLPYFSSAVRAGIARARITPQWHDASVRRGRRRSDLGVVVTP